MKELWQKISTFVANVGENDYFVSFWAHSGFAFMLSIWLPSWWTTLGIVLAAGVKEFWFDANYEKNPPQTWLDNVTDFAGYVAGTLFAQLYWHLHQ